MSTAGANFKGIAKRINEILRLRKLLLELEFTPQEAIDFTMITWQMWQSRNELQLEKTYIPPSFVIRKRLSGSRSTKQLWETSM